MVLLDKARKSYHVGMYIDVSRGQAQDFVVDVGRFGRPRRV
jgi:hypothetical protein